MSKKTYRCDPARNTKCTKENCHVNGGECYMTFNEEFEVKKCQYYDTCPSSTGWCLTLQPSGRCVEFLLAHIERLRRENGEH